MKQRIPVGSGLPLPLHTTQVGASRSGPHATPPAQTATSTQDTSKPVNPFPTARFPYVRGTSRLPTARPVATEQTGRFPELHSLNTTAVQRETTLPRTGPNPWTTPPPPVPPSSRPSRSSVGPAPQPSNAPPRTPIYDDALTDLDSFEVFPRESPRRPIHAYLSTHPRRVRSAVLTTDAEEDTTTLSKAHSDVDRAIGASLRQNPLQFLPPACQSLFPYERPLVFALLLVIGLSFFMLTMLVGLRRSEDENTRLFSSTTHQVVLPGSLRSLGQSSHSTRSQVLWANHVVTGNGQLLIPETFESRLNAEVAPVLQSHANKIWDPDLASSLRCTGGERQIVAFFLEKSGAMPGSISVFQPCSPSPHSRLCQNRRHVSDLRDLRITLPTHSSRYTYSVHIVEDHDMHTSSSEDFALSRRVKPLGVVSGPFQVELSDASRVALQRYCGKDRRNYPVDLRTEPVTMSNTRLLPLFELKRLFDLLSMSQTKMGQNWNDLQLSKATINPLDHSPHSITLSHLFHLFGGNMHTRTNDVGQPDILGRYRGMFDSTDTEYNFEHPLKSREDGFVRDRFRFGRVRSDDEYDEGRRDFDRYAHSSSIHDLSYGSPYQDHSASSSNEERSWGRDRDTRRDRRTSNFHNDENHFKKSGRGYNSDSDWKSREAENISKIETSNVEVLDNVRGGSDSEGRRDFVHRRSSDDGEGPGKSGKNEEKQHFSESLSQEQSSEGNFVKGKVKGEESRESVAEVMKNSNLTTGTPEKLEANLTLDNKNNTENAHLTPGGSLANETSNALLDGSISAHDLPRGAGGNETSSLPTRAGQELTQGSKSTMETWKQITEPEEKGGMLFGPPQGPLYRRRYWTPPTGLLPGAPGMFGPRVMDQRRGVGMSNWPSAPGMPNPNSVPYEQLPGSSAMHSSWTPRTSGPQLMDHRSGLATTHSQVWPNMPDQFIRPRSEIPTAHQHTSDMSASQRINRVRGAPDMHTALEMSDLTRRSNLLGASERRMDDFSDSSGPSQQVPPFETTPSGPWPTRAQWSPKTMSHSKATWPLETNWPHPSTWSSKMKELQTNKFLSDSTGASFSKSNKMRGVDSDPRMSYLLGRKGFDRMEQFQNVENPEISDSKLRGGGSFGRSETYESNGQYNSYQMPEIRGQTSHHSSIGDRTLSLPSEFNPNNKRTGWVNPQRFNKKRSWNEMDLKEYMNSRTNGRQQLPHSQGVPSSVRMGMGTGMAMPEMGGGMQSAQQGNEFGPFTDHYHTFGSAETLNPTMTHNGGMPRYYGWVR